MARRLTSPRRANARTASTPKASQRSPLAATPRGPAGPVGTTDAHTRPHSVARALARAGLLSDFDAVEACRRGRVRLDGRLLKTGHEPLTAGRIQLDGKTVDLRYVPYLLGLYKPADTVCSRTAQHGATSVFSVLEMALRAGPLDARLSTIFWHCIGRLDKDTTGMLLFTNDEEWVELHSSPAHDVAKVYLATVGAAVTDAKLAPLRAGLSLDDGPCLPAEAERVDERTVRLVLHEGRNHQAKRMLGAVGLPVLRLHRAAVGDHVLPAEAQPGEVWLLTAGDAKSPHRGRLPAAARANR